MMVWMGMEAPRQLSVIPAHVQHTQQAQHGYCPGSAASNFALCSLAAVQHLPNALQPGSTPTPAQPAQKPKGSTTTCRGFSKHGKAQQSMAKHGMAAPGRLTSLPLVVEVLHPQLVPAGSQPWHHSALLPHAMQPCGGEGEQWDLLSS